MPENKTLVRRQNGPGTACLRCDQHQTHDILVGEWISATSEIHKTGMFGSPEKMPADAEKNGQPFMLGGVKVQIYSSPASFAAQQREANGEAPERVRREHGKRGGKYEKTSTKKSRNLHDDDTPVALVVIDVQPGFAEIVKSVKECCPRSQVLAIEFGEVVPESMRGLVDFTIHKPDNILHAVLARCPESILWIWHLWKPAQRGELISLVEVMDRNAAPALKGKNSNLVVRSAAQQILEAGGSLRDIIKGSQKIGQPVNHAGKRLETRGRRKYRSDIGIVVTVHNALRDTAICIESLGYDPGGNIKPRVYVVDDCSVPFAGAYLSRACEENKWIYIRNEKRTGYIDAVNRGIEQAIKDECRWVCILNSDTLVTPGWLGRLVRAGESADDIALVGPFSNDAVHLSLPEWAMAGEDPISISEKIAFVSKRNYPAAVTPTGFCLLINSKIWAKHGPFEKIAGEAYGEETVMWAKLVEDRWRAVVADNALVWHRGHASYGQNKGKIAEGLAVKRFLAKYGAIYHPRNEAFKNSRATEIDYVFARIPYRSDSTRPRVCFWCHNWGVYGGVLAIANIVNHLILQGWDARVATIRVDPDVQRVLPMLTQPVKMGSVADFLNRFRDEGFSNGVLVATVWNTAEEVKRVCEKRKDLRAAYFVQDYESTFLDSRGELLTDPSNVHATYRLIENKIINSQWVKDRMESEHGATGCTLVPVGVDCTLFHPRPKQTGAPTVLFFTRPETPYRGVDMIRTVCHDLAKRDPKIRLLTYGGTCRGLPHTVEQFGVIPQRKVAELYAEADVFLEASMTQGFGLQGLEAMASECALVSTRNQGIDNYGEDGKNCVLVDVNDAAAATEEIMLLLGNNEHRRTLTAEGMLTAPRFGWDRIAREHAKVYQRILNA